MLAALLSGLAPALLSSRQDVGIAIKQSAAAGNAGAGHNLLRQLLVVGEMALAVILVIGATLALRSFARILSLDPGFRPDHLVTMRIEFPAFRFAKAEQATDFVQQVLDNVRAIPGVESASAGLVFPIGDLACGNGLRNGGVRERPKVRTTKWSATTTSRRISFARSATVARRSRFQQFPYPR